MNIIVHWCSASSGTTAGIGSVFLTHYTNAVSSTACTTLATTTSSTTGATNNLIQNPVVMAMSGNTCIADAISKNSYKVTSITTTIPANAFVSAPTSSATYGAATAMNNA